MATKNKAPSAARLKRLDALVLDCDGVLTTGDLHYDTEGRRLLTFHARDGLGLAFLCKAGVKVAVLSGRPVDIAERRHAELGVGPFVGRCHHKGRGLMQLCERLGIEPHACAFVGDDIADIPAFVACGLSIAVADAAPEVKRRATWVTRAPGGQGAVREVCEAILKARGDWQRIIERLSTPSSA